MKKIIILFCLVFLFNSCVFEITNTNNNNQEEITKIENLIYGIFNAYNEEDIFEIMSYFAGDFLHNNIDYDEERNIWFDRFGEYAIVSNLSISIFGNYATVSFSLDINGAIYVVSPISSQYSDVTYLSKINNMWKICGNQQHSIDKYSVSVDSDPTGARIYVNGQMTDYLTPHTFDNFSEGNYTIGIYLMGYNEIGQEIYVDEDKFIDFQLQLPGYPKPIIKINSPEDGEVIYENQFLLSGYIQNFEEDFAILNFNGIEYTINVTDLQDFHEYFSLNQYQNELFLRATNYEGNTGVSTLITFYFVENEDELQIVLTWDTDSTDVDLHIWGPENNHCYWNEPNAIPNGYLNNDVNDGYGPEIFYMEPVSIGTYVVKAHFYDGYSESNPTSAEVSITFSDNTTYFGPYEFTADGDDDGAWWNVTSFDIYDKKLQINNQNVKREIDDFNILQK